MNNNNIAFLDFIISNYKLDKNSFKIEYKQQPCLIHIIWFITLSINNIKVTSQSINKCEAENIALKKLLAKL